MWIFCLFFWPTNVPLYILVLFFICNTLEQRWLTLKLKYSQTRGSNPFLFIWNSFYGQCVSYEAIATSKKCASIHHITAQHQPRNLFNIICSYTFRVYTGWNLSPNKFSRRTNKLFHKCHTPNSCILFCALLSTFCDSLLM